MNDTHGADLLISISDIVFLFYGPFDPFVERDACAFLDSACSVDVATNTGVLEASFSDFVEDRAVLFAQTVASNIGVPFTGIPGDIMAPFCSGCATGFSPESTVAINQKVMDKGCFDNENTNDTPGMYKFNGTVGDAFTSSNPHHLTHNL